MFTGIVQAVGTVRSIQSSASGMRLHLEAPGIRRPIADGASICVNGVCLTVTSSDETFIAFDVVAETLTRSTLGKLSAGRRVNLEASLRAGDPLDGHLVQGHVDGVARVVKAQGGLWTFAPQRHLLPFVIPKGSIALDGVSLTLAEVQEETFRVALIPTTLANTTLGGLKPGDMVNVETDIVARTIVTTMQRLQSVSPAEPLTLERLQAEGW